MQQDVISAFDRSTMGRAPYCRCVILQLARGYDVLSALDYPTSTGALLFSMAGDCLAFKQQDAWLSLDVLAALVGEKWSDADEQKNGANSP